MSALVSALAGVLLVSDVALMVSGGIRPMDSPDLCWALFWHRSSLPGSFTVVENVGLGGALTQVLVLLPGPG